MAVQPDGRDGTGLLSSGMGGGSKINTHAYLAVAICLLAMPYSRTDVKLREGLVDRKADIPGEDMPRLATLDLLGSLADLYSPTIFPWRAGQRTRGQSRSDRNEAARKLPGRRRRRRERT